MRAPAWGVALGLLVASAAEAKPAVVVLDPGHGGVHAGTVSKDGAREKDVVLRIARHAKAALEKAGHVVHLTREGDKTLALDARVARANAVGAAVFVSIHNNSAPVPHRRGVETYILSARASDEVAAALLHAEEAEAHDEHGFGGGGGGSDLDFILDDLDRSAAQEKSAALAKAVQDRLGKVRGLGPSRGLRQAPFRVLKQASMPAVLVEIGYLSHEAQAKLLASTRGQRAAGQALAKGIAAFLKAERRR